MTPKEKARDLRDKAYLKIPCNYDPSMLPHYQIAKDMALIYVDELLDFMINKMSWDLKTNGNIHFWQEVKEEINKL